MATVQTGDNKWAVARYIVDQTPGQGTHTTITAAMADAVSGDVIAVRQGTYTEDFTIVPGVTLTTMGGGEYGGVTVVGKVTMTAAGTSVIFGMRLQTNSDFAVAVTGSAASILVIENSFINCTNNTGISFTSSSASSVITLINCQGDVGTTGIAIFSHSGSGNLSFNKSQIGNSGGSSTANTCSSGQVNGISSLILNPLTYSGTGAGTWEYSILDTNAVGLNTTVLTAGGSGAQTFKWCRFSSGSATAITTTQTLTIAYCTIKSSNSAAISGAGTINYAGLVFDGTSSNITVTTQTPLNTGPSVTIGSSNSGATNTLTVTNLSNTATSSANIVSSVGGSTAADPTYQAAVSGVTTWTWGVDNSVTSPTADPFVLAQGTALGTNNVMSVATSGEINYPLQPAFLAYQASNANNATGDGTAYTLGSTVDLTEVFDQNADFDPTTGTFTAPVTGKYQLTGNVYLGGGTAMTALQSQIITSNRTYTNQFNIGAAAVLQIKSHFLAALADMDAGDTAIYNISSTDSGGKVDDVTGSADPITYFCGNLEC